MSLHLDTAGQPAIIRLQGVTAIDDVEPLLDALRNHPDALVDLEHARHIHAALLQILLRHKPAIAPRATDEFVRERILPLLSTMQPSEQDKENQHA